MKIEWNEHKLKFLRWTVWKLYLFEGSFSKQDLRGYIAQLFYKLLTASVEVWINSAFAINYTVYTDLYSRLLIYS